MDRRTHRAGEWTLALLLCAVGAWAQAQPDPHRFDDSEVADIDHPAWFKQSFLDLREDLVEAEKAKKRGVLLFFSSRSCSYCKTFLDSTLAEPDIRDAVQNTFDVIGLDIFSGLEVIDVTGHRLPIKDFAVREGARFTPTLIFYDTAGARMLRIVGYYPPETFRGALAYLIGGHYKQEPLREFISRYQDFGPQTGAIERDEALFSRPPHILDRRAAHSPRPLLVLFERPGCEPCARFHRNVLSDSSVRSLIKRFEAVQLDATEDKSVLMTPSGDKLTPRKWAEQLNLAYAPALVFFDERGQEVLRTDSEILRYRAEGALAYVLEKGYLDEPQFQRWRFKRAIEEGRTQR